MRPLLLLSLLFAAPLLAQGAPLALTADPPRDPAHPARLEAVRYPTAGVEVPARLFV